MRDLLASARRGPKALLTSLADLPAHQPLTIAGALLGIALLLLFGGLADTRKDVNRTNTQVTRVNKVVRQIAAACNDQALRVPAASDACARRLTVALLNCRNHPSCRAAFLANLRPPVPKGVVHLNPSTAGQQPAPAPAGGHGGHTHPHHPHSHQAHHTNPPPSTSPPAPESPPESPGNSGEAPGHTGENPGQSGAPPPGQSGGNHGTEVCAGAVISACAEVGLGL